MNEEETNLAHSLIDDIEFLLDYGRRVSQRLLVEEDIKRLQGIRANLKIAKEVFRCS